MEGLEEGSVLAERPRLKRSGKGAFSRPFRVCFRSVYPLLRCSREVLAVACALGSLGAAAGCGDDFADPIVRAAPAAGGAGVAVDGGNSTGDLCMSCNSRSDCHQNETCIALSHGGDHFCSRACGMGNPHCPNGYTCNDVNNVSSPQCVPETGDCQSVVY
jgi:hypothetical protein